MPSKIEYGRVWSIVALLAAIPLLSRCSDDEQDAVVQALLRQAQNNTVPVARAAAPSVSASGVQLTLDGTHSYDPDGDELKYHWRVDSRPEGSALSEAPFSANGDRNASYTTVQPDVVGTWIFALTVEDDVGAVSASDFVVVQISSAITRPVADAGPNLSTLEGSQVCLDGVNSHDPAAQPLTYEWTLVTVPEGSTQTTADITASGTTACFTPAGPGAYAFALVVNNGATVSDPDFAFVSAGSTNQGPVAGATIVQAASCGFVRVSGASSTDPEGDVLFYQWDVLLVPEGSAVALGGSAFDDATAQEPRFYADIPGTYTVQLLVNDGEDYSAPVFVEIEAAPKPTNTAPVIVVTEDAYFWADGPTCAVDAYGNCGACPNCPTQRLDLSAIGTFDPDGDPVTVTWSILSGPANTSVAPTDGELSELTIPGPPGSCTSTVQTNQVQVQATASDCSGGVTTDVVTVVYQCG